MTSFFRRSGTALTDYLRLASDPAAESGAVQVYAKVVYGIAQLFARVGDGTVYQLTPRDAGSLNKGAYGDGSDGNVTIVGTVTLTRDMYYDQLTIPAGAVLQTASFRVYARTSITNEGTIRNNGGAGGTPTAGTATALGSLRPSGAGGAGSTTNGSAGGTVVAGGTVQACPVGYTGAGGAGGGAAGGGGGTGGAGGGASTIGTLFGDARMSPFMSRGAARGYFTSAGPTLMAIRGGGGGGGGDGAGGLPGGGGGGGGGIVVLCSRQIDNSSGAIEAQGGAGGPGSAACGGGGGGAGGVVYLITDQYTGVSPSVAGGAAGAGTGVGTPAAAGSSGLVIGPLPG